MDELDISVAILTEQLQNEALAGFALGSPQPSEADHAVAPRSWAAAT